MAGDQPAAGHRLERRRLGAALCGGEGTARVEGTAGRHIHLVGRIALQQHPLAPLEPEVVLVQSNGMAEWVKMEMARMGGVCAAMRVELPSRFLWRTYRQVLGREAVPG